MVFPPGSREVVLSSAAAFARERGLAIRMLTWNQILMTKGDEIVTGLQSVLVTAVDTPQGVSVGFEAWVEGLGEFSADPNAILGAFTRRAAWRLVEALARRLGMAEPHLYFRHG